MRLWEGIGTGSFFFGKIFVGWGRPLLVSLKPLPRGKCYYGFDYAGLEIDDVPSTQVLTEVAEDLL